MSALQRGPEGPTTKRGVTTIARFWLTMLPSSPNRHGVRRSAVGLKDARAEPDRTRGPSGAKRAGSGGPPGADGRCRVADRATPRGDAGWNFLQSDRTSPVYDRKSPVRDRKSSVCEVNFAASCRRRRRRCARRFAKSCGIDGELDGIHGELDGIHGELANARGGYGESKPCDGDARDERRNPPHMRVLHEEVLSRIATTHEGRRPTKRKPRT